MPPWSQFPHRLPTGLGTAVSGGRPAGHRLAARSFPAISSV